MKHATTWKLLGLALAATAIPSCSSDWDWESNDEEWATVTVYNDGNVTIDVVAEAESWWDSSLRRDDVRLAPGQSLHLDYWYPDVGRLKVKAYRTMDAYKVYDDFWDRDDLDDLDQRVSVSIR